MTLADKIRVFESCANEVAMGYNDSGCFWRFVWGNRGTGGMIPGIPGDDYSSDDHDFETSLDECLLKIFGTATAIGERANELGRGM